MNISKFSTYDFANLFLQLKNLLRITQKSKCERV